MPVIYGTAIPFMFVISLIGFTMMWFNERVLISYFYAQPPAYDTEVTEATLKIMKVLPFLSLFFAFWQLGNR